MHEIFTVSWVFPLHLQETLDRLSPSCFILKRRSWVTDERLSSFRVGNLLFPSCFQFKIHATDSSHKQYFAFVPSGIDTTEIYKETGPNASRLKTGKSTGDKNMLMKKKRESVCVFVYLLAFVTWQKQQCVRNLEAETGQYSSPKNKEELLSRLHSALNKRGVFPTQQGKQKLHI